MEQRKMSSFIEDTVTQTKNKQHFRPDCDFCGRPKIAQQINGNEENDVRFNAPQYRAYTQLNRKRYCCAACHERLRPGNKPKSTTIHWKEVLNQYG